MQELSACAEVSDFADFGGSASGLSRFLMYRTWSKECPRVQSFQILRIWAEVKAGSAVFFDVWDME